MEAIESGENQGADLTTNGYLVRHKSAGVSVLHIGYLHEPYEELEALWGRIEFLIHMKVGVRTPGVNTLNAKGQPSCANS